ncbi:UNVERIFIED_CONTAM: hypothetical protein Slati_4260500 [Sesamum latifolium]|uniref:DUF4283 domain-containing protein n=1 Tax=Sesamum latifolium TaxID=2727402 RepID=A0AAW2TC39_9LAMI
MAHRVTTADLGRFSKSTRLRDDEEDETVVPDGLWNSDTGSFKLCLVGRLLASRSYNFEGFGTAVKGMFNVVKGVEIKQLREGRLLFKFNHIIDMDRARNGCPWSFDKYVLIMNRIGVDDNPIHVNLNYCDLYVHVHDLLLSRMNLGVATFIGNTLGLFWDMEMDDEGCSWGATLRIRVGFNVTKPLKRALKIKTTMGEEHMVRFTYERLLASVTSVGPWAI